MAVLNDGLQHIDHQAVCWRSRRAWVADQGQSGPVPPDTVSVPNAPSIADLHAEYVEKGGRFFACPVCVKTRGLEDATLTKNAEVKGAPSFYEFTAGGALLFNY